LACGRFLPFPDGWVAQYSWREGHPEQQETFFVTYARRDATARIELEQAAARELNENEIKQTLEKNGRTIQVDRFGDVMLELGGTLIEIHSTLPLERLLDVAAKLVPPS
jgi:hypothetical protein